MARNEMTLHLSTSDDYLAYCVMRHALRGAVEYLEDVESWQRSQRENDMLSVFRQVLSVERRLGSEGGHG